MKTIVTAAIVLFLSTGLGGEGFPPVTLVKIFHGAEYRGAEAKGWAPASPGMTLSAKDSVQTLNNSYADMQLDPPNVFRLKENSRITVRDLGREAKEADGSVVKLIDLDLLQGDLLAKLDRLPSGTRLSLRSPVAIAAVRGTTLSLGYAPASRTSLLSVSRGEVRVQAEGEPDKYVDVGAQSQAAVAPWGSAVIEARGTGVPPKELLIKRLGDPSVPLDRAREMLERLKKARPSLENLTLSGRGEAAAPPGMKVAGDAKAAALAAARARAQEEIIRGLEGIRLSDEETVGDLMGKDAAKSEAVSAAVRKARAVKEEYDKRTGRAVVELALNLTAVRGAIGRDISYAWRDIRPVSLEEYAAAFGGFIRVAAKRAAKVDAYRRLAERIFGTVVTSRTTLKNLVVENDRIEFAVRGVVQGAEEVSTTYYSDGSVAVVLRVTGGALKGAVIPVAGDVLGAHYMSSPSVLSAGERVNLLQAEVL